MRWTGGRFQGFSPPERNHSALGRAGAVCL